MANITNIKINRISNFYSGCAKGQTVAFASLTYEGLTLTGFSIVAHKNGAGYFVSNPQRKSSDGKYYTVFFDPASKYDRETKKYTPGPVEKALHEAILTEFNKTQPSASAPASAPASGSGDGDGLFDWE